MAKATKVEEKKNTTTLEIPVGEKIDQHYCRRHVQLHLNREQAIVLRRIQDGLDASGATIGNGKHVATPAAALMWMLEQIKA